MATFHLGQHLLFRRHAYTVTVYAILPRGPCRDPLSHSGTDHHFVLFWKWSPRMRLAGGGGSCKLAHPFVEHLPFVYLPCLCARTRDARLHLCTSMRALHVSVFTVSSCWSESHLCGGTGCPLLEKTYCSSMKPEESSSCILMSLRCLQPCSSNHRRRGQTKAKHWICFSQTRAVPLFDALHQTTTCMGFQENCSAAENISAWKKHKQVCRQWLRDLFQCFMMPLHQNVESCFFATVCISPQI